MLKVQFPHRECEHEAEALRRWSGDGAIRLLAHDAIDHVLLVERCEPGSSLGRRPDVAVDVLADLLRRTLVPAGQSFAPLADEAARWAGNLPASWEAAGRPYERRLVDAAVELLAALPADPAGEPVLVHQDLHADNVLCAQREPWLLIDPKPLAAEAAFAPAPIVRSHELGHSSAEVWRRVDLLGEALGVDRQRVAAWAFAQTLAWSFHEGRAVERHVDTARWLLADLA